MSITDPPSLTTEWEIASMVLRERRIGRGLYGKPSPEPRDDRLATIAIGFAVERAAKARRAMELAERIAQ